MNGIIHFIKKELIITIISSIIFGFSFYLYQSQKQFNKKEEIENLKQTIIIQKRKLKKDINKYQKEKKFEKKIKNLKIIDKPATLDIYKTADKLKRVFFEFFGTKNIKIFYKPVNIKVRGVRNYIFYRIDMVIPYINKKQIIDFFNYLKDRYFYIINVVNYNTKSQKFKISIYLLGKKGRNIRRRRYMRMY